MEKQIFIVTLYYKTKVWDGISLNMNNKEDQGKNFQKNIRRN